MKTTPSIGIRDWAQGLQIIKIWETGEGDSRLIGWQRADGDRAIETNADPLFDVEEGFAELWAANDCKGAASVAEVVRNAPHITVVNDGAVRYPVMTAEMITWIDRNGEITSDNYEQFCTEVDCIGEKIAGTVGGARMIELCAALVDAGADTAAL